MNTQVKKQYQELIALLQANENKKISTIMPDILELVTGNKKARTFVKDSEGNVVAIYCYYHKQWELLSEVEYGKKANSSTGLNTMCKQGVSHWTKNQRAKAKRKEELLKLVASGEMAYTDIDSALQELDNTEIVMDVNGTQEAPVVG
jgi:hypothetical protein